MEWQLGKESFTTWLTSMLMLDILSRKVSEGDLRNSLNPKKRGREHTPPPR
jgi:hypothetical protein